MQTSSLCGKPDDDESRREWTVKDWWLHVGAWENEHGQLCFGSTMAFSAMLTQFSRVQHKASKQDLAYTLISQLSLVRGRPVEWAEAIEITATITGMPEAEKQRLLDLDS